MPTLEWIGKSKVINHHQEVPFRVLERKYSFDENGQHNEDNGSENMIIRGDNLEALKALLPRYEGRIKCIYIDPPYNTGNEGWVYNDNVNDPKILRWLGELVGKAGEDLTRHDKWLCMMYPRLKLLYKLLIEPTEAKIVEYIYESCLEGATPAEIAAALTEQGIKSPKGKDFWRAATIRGILRNEKYCGDALMQKTCTIDFREHKSVKNTMLNKYFKEEHHTAIIKKSDWQKVQQILDEKPLPGKSARLHAMPKRFTVTRSKDKYFRGYIILDPRWTASERRELLKELKNL